MSVGGDIVSEVIALLQPVYDAYGVVIREYGGELDDKDKDTFKLPQHLYLSDVNTPISAVLVEFAGVEHKPQDTSLLDYLSTYRVNVWIIAGYIYRTVHKEGGASLQNELGLSVYDAVLDSLVARKLLEGSDRLKLERSARHFYGSQEADQEPFPDNTAAALVYKLEFSLRAQSIWADPPQVEAMQWYSAGGPVVERSGFESGMEVSLNPYLIDFNDRVVQNLPVTRIGWRAMLPRNPIPAALFSADDPENTQEQIVDLVDGTTLELESGGPVLHRQVAAGLYAPDWNDLIRFNPPRALVIPEAGALFAAADGKVLNPTTDPLEAIGGFYVARFSKAPAAERELMSKWDGIGPGWQLFMDSSGYIGLRVQQDAAHQTVINVQRNHASACWIAILLFVDVHPSPEPSVIGLETSLGVAYQGSIDWLATLSNEGALFRIGGAACQITEALCWREADPARKAAVFDNRDQLFTGMIYPPNVQDPPGVHLERDHVIGTVGGRAPSGDDVVVKFAADPNLRTPQDPYAEIAGRRMLPHDRARTNLLDVSEEFSLWSGATSGQALGPDGMPTAYRLDAGSSITHDVVRVEGDHVVSVWARSSAGGPLLVLTLDGVSEEIPVTSRWRRYLVSKEVGAPPPATVTVGIACGGAPGGSIDIFGAQLEEGTSPTAYIPTAGVPAGAAFTSCYLDWTVLPGPTAGRGTVQAGLVPGQAMVEMSGPETFVAFEVREGSEHYLRVHGTYTRQQDVAQIVWRLEGSLAGGNMPSILAPGPTQLSADVPVQVSARWSEAIVELWIEGELAGRGVLTVPMAFDGDPDRCHLMRDEVGTDVTKWIGACKDIRWWK